MPMSSISADLALPSMVSMASGVVALMMNSFSMLPLQTLASETSFSIPVRRPRFCVSLAPPSMAHCPNRALSVDSFSASGRLFTASNTFSSVPVPSVCIDFAICVAENPSRSNAASWAAVAVLPFVMLV